MKRYLKRLITIVFIFVICLALFLKFIYINSPEKAIFFYNKMNIYSNDKILKKITINQNARLFISMENENVRIYIINRSTLNHWKVTQELGVNEVYDHNPNKNGCAFTTLRYNKNTGYNFVYWGTINAISVKKVTMNKEICKIEKLKSNLYAWYHFGNKRSLDLKIVQ